MATTKRPREIAPERLYPLRAFQEASGIAPTRMREARLAGQQFSRGGDDVARQQLDRLDRIHKELIGIRRKEGGLVAF